VERRADSVYPILARHGRDPRGPVESRMDPDNDPRPPNTPGARRGHRHIYNLDLVTVAEDELRDKLERVRLLRAKRA
jgi:hypothetical protein